MFIEVTIAQTNRKTSVALAHIREFQEHLEGGTTIYFNGQKNYIHVTDPYESLVEIVTPKVFLIDPPEVASWK